MEKDDLLNLIADDDLGLLAVKPKKSQATVDERLLESFRDINAFVREHGREPESTMANITEFQYFNRLKALRADPEKVAALKDHDEHGLLASAEPQKQITSVADIFDDDSFGLLDDEAESIFTLSHVPKHSPDKIAQRKQCKDFDQFEPLFQQCREELVSGLREARQFTGEQQITAGHFFILHGITVYVAEVGERTQSGKKYNARLRCIFENGTESEMLLRSLATELYKDETGRRILDPNEKALDGLSYINGDDEQTGFIYVLRSLSTVDEIRSQKHLFKIGYSTMPVEQRVKNSSEEPTYLMAPVQIVTVFQCYNLNPQKLELLLHTFFGAACLNVDVFDKKGQRHSPREWFIAPLHIIEHAVNLVINREIVNYRYDATKQEIVTRA